MIGYLLCFNIALQGEFMKTMRVLIGLVVFVLSMTACAPQAAPAAELKKTSIQLSWTHEYSVAPLHVAMKEGFFTAQGLDVTLVEGGFGEAGYIDPRSEVESGQVDFGLSSGSSLIAAVNEGSPIVAVANVLQRSPLAIMTTNRSIQTLQNLPGHSVMVADGGARDAFEALLVSQGIDVSSVRIVPRTTFGVEPIVNGEVDALVAWRINEGVALEEQGLNPIFFLFSDYGIENYEFVLFTRQELIDTQPDVVQAMVNALHQGNLFVISNPIDSIDHTMTYAPNLDRTQQLQRLESTIPLMVATGSNEVTMEQAVWESSLMLIRAKESIAEDFDLSKVYTNRFAEAVPE